jgi:hypothetical protein
VRTVVQNNRHITVNNCRRSEYWCRNPVLSWKQNTLESHDLACPPLIPSEYSGNKSAKFLRNVGSYKSNMALTSQKTPFFIVTAMKTSNLTNLPSPLMRKPKVTQESFYTFLKDEMPIKGSVSQSVL